MKSLPLLAKPWALTKCKPCSSKGLKIIPLDQSGIQRKTLLLLHHDGNHQMYLHHTSNDIETTLQHHEHIHQRARSRTADPIMDIRLRCPRLPPIIETKRMTGKLLLRPWRRGITLATLRNDRQAAQDQPNQAKYSGRESGIRRIRSS